jgi:deoxycytidine triphosphate deaminase
MITSPPTVTFREHCTCQNYSAIRTVGMVRTPWQSWARTATALGNYRSLRYLHLCVSIDGTNVIDVGANMPSLSKKRRDLLSRFHPPSEHDPHPSKLGVLLSDEIQFYAEHHNLIWPFHRENLKPAAYELTLGDEYFLNGEYRSLGSDNTTVRIPPFEVAVLKTAEILCLPRYIIGRWNIKVRHAYSGLLWVGGPQVDPGWVGHLFCPIYNLSDKPVTLRIGDQIAVIDFVKTTPFDETKSKAELLRYRYPPIRNIMQDFQIDGLRSALFTTAGQKLKDFEEAITTMTTRFTIFTQISFAILP